MHNTHRGIGRGIARTTLGLGLAGALATGALTGCAQAEVHGIEHDTIRVAVMGGPGDTLDVGNARTMMSYAVGLNVYDSLAVLVGGEVRLQLATSVTPNEDATEWTIVLRDDAVFHTGEPVTAADALFSLRTLAESPAGQAGLGDVDFAASAVVDDHTFRVAMQRPRADFVEAVIAGLSVVFPEGTTDFTDSIVGSGPYRLESFDADTGAVLVANEDYWGGAPEVERLEILPVADETARLAALTDGQVDYASNVSATSAEKLSGQDAYSVTNLGLSTSSAYAITLNTTLAPFDDPEVREAMRLAVDREQLVDVVLRGEGEVGNDLVGAGLVGFADDIPQRKHDAAAAKRIFEAKGVKKLSVVVSEISPGITDSMTIVKQQLADIGVELEFIDADPTTLFSDLTPVHEANMFAMYYANRPAATTLPMFFSAGAPHNFSGWEDPEFTRLLAESQAEVDDDARAKALTEAQQILHETGGLLVWGYMPGLEAHATGISGVVPVQGVPVFGEASFVE